MVLNNFFDRFIFTSQLRFKDYNFFVMDIPFVIVPTDILLDMSAADNPDANKFIYYMMKSSTQKYLIPKLRVGTTKEKFLELAQTFFTASGWGLPQNLSIDEPDHRAILSLQYSPISKVLVGKAKFPVDHYFRAIAAAIFTEYFHFDVECVETACIAQGKGACSFVIKPLKECDFTKEETRRQLSLMQPDE